MSKDYQNGAGSPHSKGSAIPNLALSFTD